MNTYFLAGPSKIH